MAANGQTAAGPGDGQEAETGVDRKPACPGPMTCDPLGPEMVYMRGCVGGILSVLEPAPLLPQTTAPMMPLGSTSVNMEAPHRWCSPELVEMDEIMAAMVLTSLSSVFQRPPHPEPAKPSWSADMDCGGGGAGGGGGGGGELSDSGSSGFWSWDPSSVSPAPSPSVTETDSSPDEGLPMELTQGEELSAKKAKCWGVYKCLWPGCAKVLTSSVGMKRHIRMLHLGGGSESQREEDFYYTRLSNDAPDPPAPPPPSQATPPHLAQATPPQPTWTLYGSPPTSDLPPAPFRPRAHSTCGTGVGGASSLSRSAPSSFWQIHSEHLYQACPVSVAPQTWTPAPPTPTPTPTGLKNNTMVKPRCRSVSVGEQWLQNNSAPSRLTAVTASPSRSLCSFRKARGEAKKCRKVYGVERKEQWCTSCRWKKACQRFPD